MPQFICLFLLNNHLGRLEKYVLLKRDFKKPSQLLYGKEESEAPRTLCMKSVF